MGLRPDTWVARVPVLPNLIPTFRDKPLAARAVDLVDLHRNLCATPAQLSAVQAALSDGLSDRAERYPGLNDELAQIPEVPFTSDPTRSATELAALEEVAAAWGRRPPGAELLDLIRQAQGETTVFRTIRTALRPDDNNSSKLYPPSESIVPSLGRLFEALDYLWPHHPATAAIVAWSGLNQIHPYDDGNGRASRTLLNLILRTAHGEAGFLPLYDVMRGTGQVAYIKHGRTWFLDDWPATMNYILDAARLCSAIQAGS